MTMRMLVAALMVAFLPALTHAGDYDGSKTLRCVSTDVVSCAGPGVCERTTAERSDLPLYVTIDFAKKRISGRLDNGEIRETPIAKVEKDDYATMVQGAEYGRAWSLVLQPDNGRFSAAIADEYGAIVLLGSCQVQ